jgi:ferredoxin
MPFKIVQDRNACIGCGACAAVCPGNWAMEGNKARPKKTKVDKLECNKDAADSCPVQCIKIVSA